eukprot:6205478-Pleurochrysis_carterae.AAC.2
MPGRTLAYAASLQPESATLFTTDSPKNRRQFIQPRNLARPASIERAPCNLGAGGRASRHRSGRCMRARTCPSPARHHGPPTRAKSCTWSSLSHAPKKPRKSFVNRTASSGSAHAKVQHENAAFGITSGSC